MSAAASKSKKTQPTTAATVGLQASGKFYAIAKSAHLLHEAFEIEIKDGVVVAVKTLSRAPDLAATVVGICTREIWANSRTLETSEVLK